MMKNEVLDDEDLSSTEAEETMPTPTSDERSPVNQDIQDEIIGVAPKTTTEEAGFSSAELSVSYKTTAKPESLCKQSLHSRDSFKCKSSTQKESEQKKKEE